MGRVSSSKFILDFWNFFDFASHQNLHTVITLCLPKLTKASLTDKLRAHIVTCIYGKQIDAK